MIRNTLFWFVSALARTGAAAARLTGQGLSAPSPWRWMGFLALGAPWLMLRWGGFALYPLHLLVAGVLLAALLDQLFTERETGLPVRPVLALCAYLIFVLLLRGEFARAFALAGATLANGAWAWAAYHVGRHSDRAEAAADGLLLFLGAGLAFELVLWGIAAFWPAACFTLNCPAWPQDPPPFRGGMLSPGQFMALVTLAWPGVAAILVLARHQAHAAAQQRVFTALAAALGLALLAGGGAWLVPAALLLWLGLYRTLVPWGDPRDAALLKRMGLWMLVAPVLFYALFPRYLGQWYTLAPAPGGRVRIEQAAGSSRVLSSDRATVFALRVSNTGAFSLSSPVFVFPRVLVTPARGPIRAADLEPVQLARALPAGDSVQVNVPVRVPPWFENGFLKWHVRYGNGTLAAPSESSAHGQRVVNAGHRALGEGRENLLSALAQRARDFENETFVPVPGQPAPVNAEKVVGDVLDTLLFSPLWGEAKGEGGEGQGEGRGAGEWRPFPANRPFLTDLFAEFGLLGLAGLLYLWWVLVRRAQALGSRTSKPGARLSWSLVPPALAILAMLGLFSPALGTFHGQWGLFLLFGFVEGRYHRLFPSRPGAEPGWRERADAALGWLRGLRLPEWPRPRSGIRWPGPRWLGWGGSVPRRLRRLGRPRGFWEGWPWLKGRNR